MKNSLVLFTCFLIIGLITFISQKQIKKYKEVSYEALYNTDNIEKKILNSLNYNNRYIGDLKLMDFDGNEFLLKDAPLEHSNSPKIAIMLRPYDCSDCVDKIIDEAQKFKLGNNLIIFTTFNNLNSVKFYANRVELNAIIYNMTLHKADTFIGSNSNNGTMLFMFDSTNRIYNFINASNIKSSFLNKYFKMVIKML